MSSSSARQTRRSIQRRLQVGASRSSKVILDTPGLHVQSKIVDKRAASRADTASADSGATSSSNSTDLEQREQQPAKLSPAEKAKLILGKGTHPVGIASEPLPDSLSDRDVRELAVMICVGCFDGSIRFPLATPKGQWVDQGIDLFVHDQPIVKRHRCTASKHPEMAGVWHREKLVVPMEMYDALLALNGVKPGPVVTDRF